MTSRILVVDDHPTIRQVVSAILERHGYDAQVAFDGQDALDALQTGEVKPDLVLLDFVMPRMNGYQFCRALRADPTLATIPVVLMSAKSDRIRDQFVQQTGALDAIAKPFDAQALVAVVENALNRVNTGRASGALLPEIDPEEPTVLPSGELETRQTDVAEIIAVNLAQVVARTLSQRPDMSEAELVAALTDQIGRDAVLEMMEAIGDARGRAEERSALSGDLASVPIGAILQLLQMESRSGVLSCRNGATEVVATLRDGLIDLVQSSGASDEFRLGRYFVEEGILTPGAIDDVMTRMKAEPSPSSLAETAEAPSIRSALPPSNLDDDQHTRATTPSLQQAGTTSSSTMSVARERASSVPPPGAREPKKLLGATLLAEGRISEAQLRSALTRQSSELLYDVLRWATGRFDFRIGPASAVVESARLGMPTAQVIMEGFRRVDEWRVLERTIGSFDTTLVRDDLALRAVDMGALPAKERTVLDAVDGARTVRAIIEASHLSSFDACRVLVQFLEARILRKPSAAER